MDQDSEESTILLWDFPTENKNMKERKYLPFRLHSLAFIVITFVGAVFAYNKLQWDKNETSTTYTTLSLGYQIDQCEEVSSGRTPCCTDPRLPVLGGIDMVNLYTQKPDTLPTMGKEEFATTLTTSMADYIFYFESEENRDEFMKNPWKYAPAYGGFESCAVGLEERSKTYDNFKDLGPSVDISKWELVDGRLYFFAGGNSRSQFLQDEEGIQKGNENWSTYTRGIVDDGVFNTNCFIGQTYFSLIMGIQSPEACRLILHETRENIEKGLGRRLDSFGEASEERAVQESLDYEADTISEIDVLGEFQERTGMHGQRTYLEQAKQSKEEILDGETTTMDMDRREGTPGQRSSMMAGDSVAIGGQRSSHLSESVGAEKSADQTGAKAAAPLRNAAICAC